MSFSIWDYLTVNCLNYWTVHIKNSIDVYISIENKSILFTKSKPTSKLKKQLQTLKFINFMFYQLKKSF